MDTKQYQELYLGKWPADQYEKERRNVLSAKRAGLSVRQTAEALQMDRRHVQDILLREEKGAVRKP